MTTLRVIAAANATENVRPLEWRRMLWVTWRQHRAALSGVAVGLGALALIVWLVGLQLHHAYGVAITCQPVGSSACNDASNTVDAMNNFMSNGILLQVVPALIGAFVGAPVLAREMETGTFRYAWTQGFERWRWALAKLLSLAIVVTVAAGAISLLFSWYYGPYFAARNVRLGITEISPFYPGLFDLRGVALAAWTLAAFAIGALAGMLIRRVVPAIVATLVAYTGLAYLAGGVLRARYLGPLVTTKLNVSSLAWILRQQWKTTRGGHLVSEAVLNRVLQAGGPQFAGKGGVPRSLTSWEYLVRHGYTQWTTYQPTSRFWPFQLIEGGWLLALSMLLLALTVWLVRRRLI